MKEKMSTAKNPLSAKEIVDTPGSEEVSKSFLEYSMSVVYSRAIPSASDGLKPVQRRLLYSMMLEGFTHDKDFVKSARPVSACMGAFHPHGDSSIYEALVKLVQPFYLNVPLVEGYGSFGDVSGSGAAAYRYTEARLSEAAQFVLQEVKEDTVDMRPNYDGKRQEPVELPVMFPTLVINGNFGIGVGFASKLAPHNSSETLEATKYLVKNPEATLKQVMKYLPGPDFPTGAKILGTDGIEEAYSTGQGVIRLRARYDITSLPRGRSQITFTELPYGVKTESIITKVKDLLKDGKLQGLADAKDLTDLKNGLRIVVETKAGTNPQAVLAELLKNTALEESFGINNTVLVNGEPRVVGMLELLRLFIEQRKSVITRRSLHRRTKRETRLHLVEGMLKSLANIDEVIKIVRNADDSSIAQAGLMKKFKLDEIQADHILGIQLRRLTKLDRIELDKEQKQLKAEIAELTSIIEDPEVLKSVLLKELDQVKKVIGAPRRSEIVGGALAEHMEAAKAAIATASVEVEDEPCFINVTAKGGIVRTSKPLDRGIASAASTTRGKFIAVTSLGRGFRVESIHVGTREAAANTVLPEKLARGEKLLAVTPVELGEGETGGVALGTVQGVVKVVAPQWPVRSDDFQIIGLADGDEILAARWVTSPKDTDLVFISSDSSLLTFTADKVRPQGLSGAGMAGIKLAAGAKALGFGVITAAEKESAVVATTTGVTVKATPFHLYPAKGRATGGVRSHKFLKGEEGLVLASVNAPGKLLTADGTEVPLPALDNRRDGSGVKVEASGLF